MGMVHIPEVLVCMVHIPEVLVCMVHIPDAFVEKRILHVQNNNESHFILYTLQKANLE